MLFLVGGMAVTVGGYLTVQARAHVEAADPNGHGEGVGITRTRRARPTCLASICTGG